MELNSFNQISKVQKSASADDDEMFNLADEPEKFQIPNKSSMSGFLRKFDYVVCLVGTILSFYPIYHNVTKPEQDDQFYDHGDFERVVFFRQSCMACVIVTLPTMIDLSIDMYIAYNKKIDGSVVPILKKETVRLTILERFLFAIAIFGIGFVSLCSIENSWNKLVYESLSCFNTIFAVVPLMTFLQRHTSLWTPMKTSIVIALCNITAVLTAVALQDSNNELSLLVKLFTYLTTLVYITIILVEMFQKVVNYCKKRRQSSFEVFGSYAMDTHNHQDPSMTYIEIIHMLAVGILLILNIVRFPLDGESYYISGIINYINVFVYAVITVVEYRVRKIEIFQGLVSL